MDHEIEGELAGVLRFGGGVKQLLQQLGIGEPLQAGAAPGPAMAHEEGTGLIRVDAAA